MKNNDELFEKLFNEFKDGIYGYFLQSVGREDAKDLVQESFIKVYRNLEKYDSNKSTAAWIYAIARNVMYDYLRKYRKQRTEGIESEDYDGENCRDLDESIELRNAVNKLEASRREVLILFYFQGLRYDEIAQVTGSPINTVKSRLNRAKDDLRKILKLS